MRYVYEYPVCVGPDPATPKCICGGMLNMIPATGYTLYECPRCGSEGHTSSMWHANEMEYVHNSCTMSVCNGIEFHTQRYIYDYITGNYTQCEKEILEDNK